MHTRNSFVFMKLSTVWLWSMSTACSTPARTSSAACRMRARLAGCSISSCSTINTNTDICVGKPWEGVYSVHLATPVQWTFVQHYQDFPKGFSIKLYFPNYHLNISWKLYIYTFFFKFFFVLQIKIMENKTVQVLVGSFVENIELCDAADSKT